MILDKNKDGKIYAYEEYSPPLRSAPTNYNMAVVNKGHQDYRVYDPDGIAPALSSNRGGSSAKHPYIVQRPHGFFAGKKSDIVPPLRGRYIQGNVAVVSCLRHGGGRGWEAKDDGTSHAIKGVSGGHGNVHLLKIQDGLNIRRLTPMECERLQGFPDDFTKYGIDENGAQIDISDSQRYKTLGNAVTVNVIQAIAKKFQEVEQ